MHAVRVLIAAVQHVRYIKPGFAIDGGSRAGASNEPEWRGQDEPG
jgi:hypothetical protein